MLLQWVETKLEQTILHFLHNFFTTPQYIERMTTRKFFTTILIVSAIIVIAGCSVVARQTVTGNTAGGAPTRAVTAVSTRLPATTAATTTPPPARTSPPTQDVISMLVTQAYMQFTPAPQTTQSSSSTAATSAIVPSDIARLLTPSATLNPGPASVIVGEPILIANAVNTADCKIRKVGDCVPTMQAGETLFFTWTFGVEGGVTFNWGQAAVVITRNGQAFKWTQVGNVLGQIPDTNESWTLLNGQTVKFTAGLDNAEPGYYTARLVMCTLSPDECDAGRGWQNVGGEAISFVVTP